MFPGNALGLQTIPSFLRLPSHLPFSTPRIALAFLPSLHDPAFYTHIQQRAPHHSHYLAHETAYTVASIALETLHRYHAYPR